MLVLVVGIAPAWSANVACDRCTMTIAGRRVTVSGTFGTDPVVVDLRARAPSWTIGDVAVTDVAIDAHARGNSIRACAAGTLGGERLVACATLPSSPAALRRLGVVEIAWRTLDGPAHGHGTARVAWSGGAVRIDAPHVELALASHVAGAELANATVSASVTGTLSPIALRVRGRAHADELASSPLYARDVEVPIDVAIGSDITPSSPVIASAAAATIDRVRLAHPALELHGASPVPFDRLAALVDEPHALAWLDLAGVPVELGAGAAVLVREAAGIRIERGHAAAFGGTAFADPFVPGAAAPLTLHLHGVSLARVLDVATDGRVRGTGIVDGDLELSRDGSGFGIERAALASRGPGKIRTHDSEKLAGSTLGPVATALAELTYDRLALVVPPPGNDPDATLVLHGRGERVPQELALTINLHGVRAVLRSFVADR